jgi:RES domain-containing protein
MAVYENARQCWEQALELGRTSGFRNANNHSMRSAVPLVPSSVEPKEWNYVINPDHPDSTRIAFGGVSAVPV